LKKRAFVLIRADGKAVETELTASGIELQIIDEDNFTLQHIPVNEVKKGQWFIFVSDFNLIYKWQVSANGQGQFLWLCGKNNLDGTIEARSQNFETLEEAQRTFDKFNEILQEVIKDDPKFN
jgi:hypothetical protein